MHNERETDDNECDDDNKNNDGGYINVDNVLNTTNSFFAILYLWWILEMEKDKDRIVEGEDVDSATNLGNDRD